MDEALLRWLAKTAVVAAALGYFSWRRLAARRKAEPEAPDPITRELLAEAQAWREAQPEPRLPADLPLPASLEEGVRLLEGWLGAASEPMPPAVLDGRPTTALAGASIPVRSSAARSVVDRLQPRWTAAGLLVFQSHFGNPFRGLPARIGILPTADPLDAVRHRGTRGEAVDADEVLAGLREVHALEPFRLLGADVNAVSGRFERAPADPRALAARLLALATTVGEHGDEEEDVDAVAAELAGDRVFDLLWE